MHWNHCNNGGSDGTRSLSLFDGTGLLVLAAGEVFVPVALELEHGLSEGVCGCGCPPGGGSCGGGPPDGDAPYASGAGPSGPQDGSPGAWRRNLDAVVLF